MVQATQRGLFSRHDPQMFSAFTDFQLRVVFGPHLVRHANIGVLRTFLSILCASIMGECRDADDVMRMQALYNLDCERIFWRWHHEDQFANSVIRGQNDGLWIEFVGVESGLAELEPLASWTRMPPDDED